MDVAAAIKMAIEYETRVRDVYADAHKKAINAVGKRVFKFLAKEEQGHLDYLNEKLAEWQQSGRVTAAGLATAVPSLHVIESGAGNLEQRMAVDDRGDEAKMLEKAYKVEVETGDFYKRMVDELGPEGQDLFRRFVEIEEGHEALVRAELDCVKGNGFFFDMQEFDLEAF